MFDSNCSDYSNFLRLLLKCFFLEKKKNSIFDSQILSFSFSFLFSYHFSVFIFHFSFFLFFDCRSSKKPFTDPPILKKKAFFPLSTFKRIINTLTRVLPINITHLTIVMQCQVRKTIRKLVFSKYPPSSYYKD